VNFDDILVDLKLTPDVLEIPVPRYFVEDRQGLTLVHVRAQLEQLQDTFMR